MTPSLARHPLRRASDRVDIEQVLAGGGDSGALMRSIDWEKTPLGPVVTWPQSLRTTVSTCLSSRSPILVWWGREMVKIYNDAYRQLLGTKHPDAMGACGRDVWPEIWHIIGPMLEGVLFEGKATWSENQRLLLERHGYLEETYFTFSYSPIRDESGGVGGVFSTVIETTGQVLSERRLRTLGDLAARTVGAASAEDACHRAVAALSHNPGDIPFALLYLVDQAGQQAHLSGAAGFTRTAGLTTTISLNSPLWPVETALGHDGGLVVGELEQRIGPVPERYDGVIPTEALLLPVRLSSEARPSAILVAGLSPLLALDEKYRGFLQLVASHAASAIASARTLSEVQSRVEALAELDRAKTVFFSNVSHEFRTPLTLMLGPTEDLLAGSHGPLPTPVREQLELLHRNELRLQRLVNALLDFSRLEAGRRQALYEPVDLATLTRDIASSFQAVIEQAGIRFMVATPAKLETIYVDRQMWEQIVLNLLSNAFKFTFDGTISVSVRFTDQDAELTVTDSGVGIAAEEMPRLFERFHRIDQRPARTHEGSGIGLALVHELVRLHGGTICAESRLNEGTSFRVTIPKGTDHLPTDRVDVSQRATPTPSAASLFVEEAARWLPAETAKTVIGNRPRVLIADDNADMRAYLHRILSSRFDVEIAVDGHAALQAIRKTPPDLILTDIMMPRLDGFGLLREVRANPDTQSIPVIMLSARAGEEAKVDGLQAGAEDYLIKPFSARELLARITTHLELAQLRKESRGRYHDLYSLFMQTPAPVCVFRGPDLVHEMANEAYCRLVGKVELVGKPLREALPEVGGDNFEKTLLEVMTTGHSAVGTETLVQRRDPRDGHITDFYFTVVYAPLRGAEGTADRVMVLCHDVTTQVLARRSIEDSEEKFRQIFEGVEASIWDEDFSEVKKRLDELRAEHGSGLREWLSGNINAVNDLLRLIHIRDVNPATVRMFDASSKEQLLSSLGEIYLPESKPVSVEFLVALAEGKRMFTSENTMRTLTGRHVDVALAVGFPPAGQSCERLFINMIDISAQKVVQREREARAADTERALRFSEMFVGILGHDLRNPLSAIATAASLLEMRADSERIAKPVGRIIASAERMERMISQLLDFTRIRLGHGIPLERSLMDLADVARSTIDELGPVHKKQIQLESVSNSRGIWDRDRITQLLSNLVANACQHSEPGIPVQIRIDGSSLKTVQLEVKNQGAIPPNLVPVVFEPFRYSSDFREKRARSSGLGLGLHITQQIILAHEGTIRVESTEEKGTRFLIEIPREPSGESERVFD